MEGDTPRVAPASPRDDLKVEGFHSENAVESYDGAERTALVRKQDWAIIPLSAFIYLLCYLDRSNIGNARILNADQHNDMQTETHTTSYEFTVALMVFLVAYCVFEVLSNVLLKKLRPSRWLAFLMFSWGAITIGLGFTKNFAGITVARFLLGAFEAGLFPGLVFYLTFWYRSDERSVRVAFILASATLAGAFGGVIAYGVGHMNRVRGISAWRWLFILEGIPSCLSAILVFFLLPDYPEEWSRLSIREKEIATARLVHEGSKKTHSSWSWQEARATLLDWRLYGHYAIYFAVSTPFSSLSLFTPTITSGLGFHDLQAQLMTVPPYVVAYIAQIIVSWMSDRYNRRSWYSAVFAAIGAAGFLASGLLPPAAYGARYACLIIAAGGTFSCIPGLLGWLTSNVHGTASATGLAIALNVGLGAGLGQIPGVWIYKADEAEIGYPTGHFVNAGLLFFASLACVLLGLFYRLKNRELKARAAADPDVEVRMYKL